MKKLMAILLLISLFIMAACSTGRAESAPDTGEDKLQNSSSASTVASVVFEGDDLNSSWDASKITYIKFDGDKINIKGDGVVVDANKAAITAGGTYYLSGKLDDGQIIVRSEDQETVRLILYGVNINCSTSAPVYVFKAKKTVITLADGTENFITDGSSYIFADTTSDEPNAAIFSKSDLTINGSGSLAVKANYYNGIQSKDDLKITGGNIIVQAANDAIKGRDSVAVKSGNITVTAGGDGLQSNNEENDKGYIAIESGTFDITAAKDGIQAESRVVINGGDITISSGGGSSNSNKTVSQGNPWDNRTTQSSSSSSDISTKGIKAGVDIAINGGNITIDSCDDSLNTNNSLSVIGGSLVIASGDDGIHSDARMEISGGDITIEKSYEGIESAIIEIIAGNISINSNDDGINIGGGMDAFPMMGQMGQNTLPPAAGQTGANLNTAGNTAPQDSSVSSSDSYLSIAGGNIYINAGGDGIDVGGAITFSGGLIIVNGPTSNNNGAIDCNNFKMTGGYLVAAGSAGMAQGPGNASTQYSVLINLASSQPVGTMFHIASTDGESVLTFTPVKTYQSIVFSSPQLEKGSTYDFYSGGSSTGTVKDGLYSDGIYTPGSKIDSFTISNIVTNTGAAGGGFPGRGGGNIPQR